MRRHIVPLFAAACALLCTVGMLCPPPAQASGGTTTYWEVAKVTTGFNRYLGQPIWFYDQLEATVPGTGLAGFSTSGAFDDILGPGGGNATALAPGASDDTVLASYVDFDALLGFGLSPGSVPDRVLNVPHDDTEVLVDPFGVVRVPVPCASDAQDPIGVSRAAPCSDAITLEDWNEASGVMANECHADGGSRVKIWLWGLRPNRMYTLWYDLEALEEIGALAAAFPLGGIHNVVTANKYGYASFERDVEFCLPEDERSLGVFVALRPGGQNYGGTPVPFLNQENPATAFEGLDGAFPGTQIVVHLQFDLGYGDEL